MQDVCFVNTAPGTTWLLQLKTKKKKKYLKNKGILKKPWPPHPVSNHLLGRKCFAIEEDLL